MKTAISIPDEVFEAAETVARRLSIPRSELYTRAVRDYLRTHAEDGVTDRLNEVYADEPSTLDPALAAMQSAALGDETW